MEKVTTVFAFIGLIILSYLIIDSIIRYKHHLKLRKKLKKQREYFRAFEVSYLHLCQQKGQPPIKKRTLKLMQRHINRMNDEHNK